MLSDLNVDQWVMVRDRHRLNRLRKGKDSNEAQYQELFEKSNESISKFSLNEILSILMSLKIKGLIIETGTAKYMRII